MSAAKKIRSKPIKSIDISAPGEMTSYDGGAEILDYLRTGKKSSLNYKGLPVFWHEGSLVVMMVFDGMVMANVLINNTESFIEDLHHYCRNQYEEWMHNRDNMVPSAIIVPEVRKGRVNKYTMILNADDGSQHDSELNLRNDCCLVGSMPEFAPTMSFSIFSMMFKECPLVDVAKMFHDGDTRLVDYSYEDWIDFTAEEAKIAGPNATRLVLDTIESPKRAEGYSVVVRAAKVQRRRKHKLEYYWHRSGNVLVESKKYGLFFAGQDEGSYFACQLKEPQEKHRIKTIEAAFSHLMPESVKKAKEYRRQGEWFAVKRGFHELPSCTEVSITFDNLRRVDDCGTHLNLDDPAANKHVLRANKVMVTKDGRVFAENFSLNHPDHRQLDGNGWWEFVRNTAIRSVSLEGVD